MPGQLQDIRDGTGRISTVPNGAGSGTQELLIYVNGKSAPVGHDGPDQGTRACNDPRRPSTEARSSGVPALWGRRFRLPFLTSRD